MAFSACMLNPPSLPGTTANREGSAGMGAQEDRRGGFLYPPQLLASAAAALQQAGWNAIGVDAAALELSDDETIHRLPRADVLVMPVSYATLAADRAFLNRLREHKPLISVVAIGPALLYPQVDHVFSDLADLLLSGEPELALPAALRRLQVGAGAAQQTPPWHPGQVVNPYTLAQDFYRPDGLLDDLDAAPVPAWEVFLHDGNTYPFLTVLSSRGCPAGCGFCPYTAAQGQEYRAQSPARTADEMEHLANRFQPGHVVFRDPVFAHDRNRVLAICTDLRRRRLELTWECESRPEHFDARLLRAMQAAGCTTIKVGLESADPDLLVAIGRVANRATAHRYLTQVSEVVDLCRQLKLRCRVYVMAGLPGQTQQSATRTARYLHQVSSARRHVKAFHWYPGIALPYASAPDLDEQLVLLQEATQYHPRRWRRLVSRVTGARIELA